MAKVYDFSLQDKKGNEVSLSAYNDKVLLIVNTATGCGFTPQYEELEALYKRFKDQGLEILDVPSNQFGHQAPGTDEEITEFCTAKFGTDFPQFKKSDVNGANELPLYTWLKSEKPFTGQYEAELAGIMEKLYNEANPGAPRKKDDIQWNFTKFLINRQGEVVARYEPVDGLAKVEEDIAALLNA
jgi:glutathione peroxidase